MKMKLLLFAVILSTLQACYELPERNCTDFKNGKFRFDYTIDDQEYSGTFNREDNLSVEYFDGVTDTASVRWINDCEYIVTKLHPKKMGEEKPVHIKILTTTNNSYTFEFNLVGNAKNKSKGTAIKIK